MYKPLQQTILKILSFIGLGLTIVPSFLVFMLVISHDMHINLMGTGMVLWFVTAPFWINKDNN